MADWLRDREQWRRQLMLGVSPEQIDLTALALLGARSRYDQVRPGTLTDFQARPTTDRLIEGRARLHLLRLFGPRPAYELPDAAGLRVLDALADAQCALHPFDYPALSRLLHADPASLDGGAAQWRARSLAPEKEPYGPLDDNTWWDATPSGRVAYLRSLRRAAPQRARNLLQQARERDTAATRGKLVAALAYGLGADDRSLLEQLYAEDRANSVRTIAERLLARLPGTTAYDKHIDDAASALEVQRGLTGVKVTAQVPKAFKGQRRAEWLEETFGAADPLGLAARLELDVDTFCRALLHDSLRLRFAVRLVERRELGHARTMARGLGVAFLKHIDDYSDTLATFDDDQASAIMALFAAKVHDNDIRAYARRVGRLYAIVRRPLIGTVAETVLEGRPLKRLHSHHDEDVDVWGWVLTELACVMPVDQLPRLQTLFGESDLSLRQPALTLTELLLDIHAQRKSTDDP